MRLALLLATLLLLVAVATAGAHVTRIPHRCTNRIAPKLCAIHFHKTRTNHLRVQAHHHPIHYYWQAERHPDRRNRILLLWMHRQSHAERLLSHYQARAKASPWTGAWYRAALCVHHGEGAWNDPNAPYYGGMQMDLSFQRAYGPEFLARYGTADHWPAHDQLLAAYRAWRSRGWSPWPNTAAACGLL